DSLSIFEQIKVFLHEKELLLILDNFEQLVTGASLVEDLLAACPSLKIIVTSRIVLRLRAEFEYPVDPLTLPDLGRFPNDTGIGQSTAVALFVQRASMVNPNFQLTRSNARAIAEICVQLDGLPLAIELAAARSRLLPPQALLRRLTDRFEILTGGAVTLPVHQQTLRNTLQWSYDLLDPDEQQLFRRLTVFERGWTLEAAEALGNVNREVQDGLPVLDSIASLIDKSLMRQFGREEIEPRFVMLMTVREFGLECLRKSGEEDLIRQAHADYYLALVEKAEPHLKGAEQLLWLARLDRAQENLRAALNWLITHEEVELAFRFVRAFWMYWEIRGYWSEGRSWLKAVLALPEAKERTSLRAIVLSAAGGLAADQGDLQEAYELLTESVALCQELNDDHGLVLSMSILGRVLVGQGDHAAASSLMKDCITLCRKLGRNWELSRSLLTFSYIVWLDGDLQQAIVLTQESLMHARELNDKALIAHAL
ncbi:MAG TPA: tetratricopeptide repeat protein, partial [Ktedonobacteraceae bacterium]|nr:tetratricopeptide repeat protein [Ktedonobacteraceae bacterium]